MKEGKWLFIIWCGHHRFNNFNAPYLYSPRNMSVWDYDSNKDIVISGNSVEGVRFAGHGDVIIVNKETGEYFHMLRYLPIIKINDDIHPI